MYHLPEHRSPSQPRPRRRFNVPRRVLVAASVLLVFFTIGIWWFSSHRSSPPVSPAASSNRRRPSANTAPSNSNNRIRFYAMGDMLAHDSIVQQAKTGGTYDFKPYFRAITPLYKDADAVFCNPETLAAGTRFGISGYPTFNAPTEFARDLRQGAKCDVINLATNHIGDKSQAAIDATLENWLSLKPLAVTGANRSAEQQRQVSYFTKNGVKVAFLAFADYSNNKAVSAYGLNLYHDAALMKQLTTEARANADAVVVSMHWGTEDSSTVNEDQLAAARQLADLGVDVVIGTGPHVLQKTSVITAANGHKTLVWYSIGNMLSSQLQIDELTGGVAGFDIVKKAQGSVNVERATFRPTFMSYEWSPADKSAGNLLARRNLTLEPLHSANGRIQSMFGSSHTADERMTFIRTTLGSEAGVEVKD